MKKSSYILGIVSLSIILIGTTFKASHLPGAAILFTIGVVLLSFAFLPVTYLLLLKTTNDTLLKWVYHAAFISFFVDFIGMLFKITYWPEASKLLMLGLPLPFVLFLPVYILYHNKRKLKTDNSFFGIILFMIYLGVFSSLLALNYGKIYLYSYASTAQTIEHGNNALLKQLNNNSHAVQLVNSLDKIKLELVLKIDKENISHYRNSKFIDFNKVYGKDKKLSYDSYLNAGIGEFNNAFEKFINESSGSKNTELIQTLINEINTYRIVQEDYNTPIVCYLTLINSLNILTDWQNKILLIEYLSEHES